MKPTTYNLPGELTDRIDEVARQSERSRSFVVRKLLEQSLNGADRLKALQEIAAAGLERYDAERARERAPNASELIADSCADGRARLDALNKIAAGNPKGTR